MAASGKFVERGKVDPKEIDKSVKNKWSWGWCDKMLLVKTINQHLVGDCYRKTTTPGGAWCLWCDESVRYGSAGLNALRQHAKCAKHQTRLRERSTNYRLELGDYNSSFHNLV